jgi:hypothetical protein
MLAQHVHLGDLLVERTAVERDAERVRDHRAVLVAQALRARVLVALVAEDAVMDLAQHLARVPARVGEPEAVAAAEAIVGTGHRLRQVGARALHLHEVEVVERLGEPEDDPGTIARVV